MKNLVRKSSPSLAFVLFTVLTAAMTVHPASHILAASRPGSPVGSIYYSDIEAYIEDMPIRSYNIGGKTVVVCEDLRQYGFSVSWHAEARVLEVRTQAIDSGNWQSVNGANQPTVSTGPRLSGLGTPGAKAGTILATDIVTYFNGHVVPSYNIGGCTVVAIEDLGIAGLGRPLDETLYSDCGFSYTWNPGKRTVTLYPLRPGQKVATDLGNARVSCLFSPGQFGWHSQKSPFRLDGETLCGKTDVIMLPVGNTYVQASQAFSALGIKWEWDSERSVLIMESRQISPVRSESDEVITAQERSFRNVCGIEMGLEVTAQSERPDEGQGEMQAGKSGEKERVEIPDAVVVGGKAYIRSEAIAYALDLIFVPNDGFYQKKDGPVLWDRTFSPFVGQADDWLASCTPSYFSALKGSIGTYPHNLAQPIRLIFTREMDEKTLNQDTVIVFWTKTLPCGRVEYGVISDSYIYSYDKDEKTLTLTPVRSLGLSPGLEVIVAIKPQVADINHNHPAHGYKTGFTAAKQ